MYDPWNVTRFRQSHQMSMPPAEQNLPPYLLSNFPIDATVPQPYMVHQDPSSIPAFGYQSDSTVYTHLPHIPVSLTETLNSSYYTQYLVSGQQDPQWTQSLYLIPSHRPPLTSPNGAEMLHLPPPPPLVGQAPSADLVCPSYPVGLRGAQNTLHPQCPQSSSHIPFVRFLPLPPPPPPPYPLERPPLPPPSPLEPPPLPPPSPSPSSPHVPAASHLLPSSHINQNLPYSSHEGMKHGDLLSRSIQLHILREEIHHNGSSSRPSQLDSLTNTGVSHLDTDSDVDMEDDITLVDNEHLVSEQLNEPQTVTAWDSQCQSFLRSESLVFEEQLKESNEVLISTAPSEVLNETYATAAEVGKYIASEPVTGVDPIPVSKYVNVSASDVRTRSSPDLVGNVGSKSLLEYGKGFRVSEDVMAYSNAFELANVYSEANQSKDNNNGTDKSYLYDASKGRGVGATPKSDMFGTKDKDCQPTMMKIDVFERSVKENASDSNYVDIGYSSRHGKGSQTRIQSGSPISKCSQKRKGRRNRSYDPLFDCLEGSSNSSTPTNAKKRKIDDSDMITPGVSYMPLGLVESNKEDNGGSAALSTSLDTNKYDQTIAEWIENENHDDTVTDVEKDQVKTSRKRMKDKSFRLMNRFKVALREFVKGVLKPYWREGNMSKVVFKMIVKKTVDKVLGAMENHKIPESEEKINRYIDSSHRKLTNLVMGYVDKFVRV